MNRVLSIVSLLIFFVSSAFSIAEEGMWTFDNPPAKLLKDKYGFDLTQEWLDKVRLSVVRINGGSGTFISPDGLIMTNHHVAATQLSRMSNDEHDYIKNGYYAEDLEDEVKCYQLEAIVLMDSKNITEELGELIDAGDEEALDDSISELSKKYKTDPYYRPQTVRLYSGKEIWIYYYKVYDDIRLVMAPEVQAAAFGGYFLDNFTFPRYCLDMTFVRAYEDGKPAKIKNYMKFNPKGIEENGLTFVAGNPGSTDRSFTLSQILYMKDYYYPLMHSILTKQKNIYDNMVKENGGSDDRTFSKLLHINNGLKIFAGIMESLKNEDLINKKRNEEKDLQERINANPEWKEKYGNVLKKISEISKKESEIFDKKYYRAFHNSVLMQKAMQIAEYFTEIGKPDGERLQHYTEEHIEYQKMYILYNYDIDITLDQELLELDISVIKNKLGEQDGFLKKLLGGMDVNERINTIYANTKLSDKEFVKVLLEGGLDSLKTADDPLLNLALELNDMVYPETKKMEEYADEIKPEKELLAQAMYDVYGNTKHPDATFTLRLSFGTAQGYMLNGYNVPWKTNLYGLFNRSLNFDNKDDYELPQRYWDAREDLDLSVPVNFITTNDIIGGNSGSSAINSNAEVIGLVFDGNYNSIAGKYIFDDEYSRAVFVHVAYIMEALQNLYDANRLVDEILGN